MLSTSCTELQGNMQSLFDKVYSDDETLFVTRSDDENLVVMSLPTYNNIMENISIMSNTEQYLHLLESKRQIEQGRAHFRELVDAE